MTHEELKNHIFKEGDFNLVQADKKITDKKMESKPTTFAKDAFKRFTKNKSSVVGAIIIAILLLMAIIVPFTCPSHNITDACPSEVLLLPKINKAGTGWWDGCKEIANLTYDNTKDTDNEAEKVVDDSNTIKSWGIIKVTPYQDENGSWRCDILYDTYAAAYGNCYKKLSVKKLNTYARQGLCKFDESIGKDSFVRLSDLCPVISIDELKGDNLYGYVSLYLELGYKKAPIFIFGTDTYGHDLFKLCFRGLGTSLIFATVIAAICFSFGLVWGAICGYFGGTIDLLLERFTDILGGIPMIAVITMMRLNLGDSLVVFGAALCITGWMGTAGTTRTQFYRFKGREYVLASRTLGASDMRLIFKHILPNALGTIVTSAVLMIPSLIFTETSLSYLGLGLQGSNSFGRILSENQAYLKSYPVLIIVPSVIISLLMISFNLFGNGLRDALNPSLKGGE